MKLKTSVMLSIIDHIKLDGSLPRLSLSERTILRYVSILKKDDIIRKVGYGTWELTGKKFDQNNLTDNMTLTPKARVKPFYKLYKGVTSKSFKPIRGHGFIVTFKIPKIAGWHNRETLFNKLGFQPKKTGIRDCGISIIFRNHIFHTYKQSIVIYSSKSYLSPDADTSFKMALYDIKEVFKSFESSISVSLKINKSYEFKVSRQHYAKINDDVAKYFKAKGENLSISNKKGVWLITDHSLNVDEIETVHKDTSRQDMNFMQPFLNDIKEVTETTGETPLLSTVMQILEKHTEHIGSLIKTQQMNAENINLHMQVLRDMRDTLKDIRDEIKKSKS